MSRQVSCDFFAGWMAGVAGIIVGQPLDTIKVYQQVHSVVATKATKIIYEKAGVAGFYRGMTIPVLTSGALNSIFFGSYGATMGFMDSNRGLFMSSESIKALHETAAYQHHHGSYLDIFIAGCVAGAVQMPVACPSDVIKVRCQAAVSSGEASKSFPVMREIFKQQGLKGFYRGGVTMLWRDILSFGVYVFSYEVIKDYFTEWFGNQSVILHQFIAGGMAGTLCWLATIPLDVTKSRIQATCPKENVKEGMFTVMKSILKEQGFKGLTRGIVLITVRAFPVNGVTFVAYEHIYKHCAAAFKHKIEEEVSSASPDTPAKLSGACQVGCYCRKW